MFYIVGFCLSETVNYCLWFTGENEKDQFLANDKGIIHFSQYNRLIDFIAENQLDTGQEMTLYDIGEAINWLKDNNPKVNCEYILSLWNAAADLAYTLGIEFSGDLKNQITNQIYDKLFWGNTLPALRGDGNEFIPSWSTKELHKLRKIVADIVNIVEIVLHLDQPISEARDWHS